MITESMLSKRPVTRLFTFFYVTINKAITALSLLRNCTLKEMVSGKSTLYGSQAAFLSTIALAVHISATKHQGDTAMNAGSDRDLETRPAVPQLLSTPLSVREAWGSIPAGQIGQCRQWLDTAAAFVLPRR